MIDGPRQQDPEISLVAIAASLVRSRWRIVRWGLAGGVLAALLVVAKPAMYSASFSFVPQGNDASRSNLASLAGQLGLTTGSSASQSPDFYVSLMKSREILAPIIRDTFVVAEKGGQRLTYLSLFEFASTPQDVELAIKSLSDMVTATPNRQTGIIKVSISTLWPSVSRVLADSLLAGINDFNLRTRQIQAAAERRFIEGRLRVARGDLQAAEDRLLQFTLANRGAAGASPVGTLEKERLQREVLFQQTIYSGLAQSLEDARIREVRDTPTITIVESPAVSAFPDPRGRVRQTLLGGIAGTLVGCVLVLLTAIADRRKADGAADISDLTEALREAKAQLLPFRRKG